MKLSKAYQPNKHEDDIYKLWEEQGAFTPVSRGSSKTFSIVVPPPNANGNLHIGHGLNMTIMDIATRYHRMKGESALLLPGADHAGFETWVVYEKQLVAKGKSRFDYSREDLYTQIWDFVAQNKDNYQRQFRQLGASVDWSRFTYTLDDKIIKQACATFKKMWDDDLVYRAEKLVNFCTYHGTGFADIEVDHKAAKGHLWHIRYPLTDGSGSVTVATTRPETMFGDTAVAVHPEDTRYATFVGKTVKLPLTNREIPIVADTYVDMEFGTGAVKITPAHDPNDYEIGQRHDLPMISVIGHDGLMTHETPEDFRGLDIAAAREKTVNMLVEQELMLDREDISHNVGHCYKCGTVIQPLLREQWFINTKPLAAKAITVLKAGDITFLPDVKRKQLITYLEGLRDWNISRQIAWGIPIPAFRSTTDASKWVFDDRVDQETIEIDADTYTRDPDVFDTWFSSSSWPYATLNFMDETNNSDFKQFYPLSIMETGADILYPWVSRMIMFGLYNTGKIPFESVYMHGLIQDEYGQKMSKSKGNVVNPIDKVTQFGADAFRMGIISGETAGSNRPYDESKIIGARNFTNKLWNIARFTQELVGDKNPSDEPKPETVVDHWILSKLQHITEAVSRNLDDMRLSEGYEKLYHFVWDDFADWYIEASKATPNSSVLAYCLETILKLTHPYAPFVTESIWQELGWRDELLITSAWPNKTAYQPAMAKQFEEIINIVVEVRQLSSDMKLAKPVLLYDKISYVTEPSNSALVKKLAKLGGIKPFGSNREGVRLTSTKHSLWLEVNTSAVLAYIKDLKDQSQEIEDKMKHLKSRLQNKSYVENAPAKIVEQTKLQLTELKATQATIKAEIAKLKT